MQQNTRDCKSLPSFLASWKQKQQVLDTPYLLGMIASRYTYSPKYIKIETTFHTQTVVMSKGKIA